MMLHCANVCKFYVVMSEITGMNEALQYTRVKGRGAHNWQGGKRIW